MDSIISLGQKNTLAEYMILSGANNRPPMLDKDLYNSWKSRLELYMQNREHGRMILDSFENGPLIWPTVEENGSYLLIIISLVNPSQELLKIYGREINLQMQVLFDNAGKRVVTEFNKFWGDRAKIILGKCTHLSGPRECSVVYEEKLMLAEAQEAWTNIGEILRISILMILTVMISPMHKRFLWPTFPIMVLTLSQSSREKIIDSQMDDMIIEKLALKEQVDSLEQNLSKQIKEKENVLQSFGSFPKKYFEINDLKARLQDKDKTICELKDTIKSLRENTKEQNVNHDKCELEPINKELENSVAKFLSENERMFKLDLVPLPPRLLQNRDAHIDYLRHTQEQANTLREIVEQAKAKQPLDSELDFACKYATRIQELLAYVQDTCPNAITPSTKKVTVSPMNNVKKVMFAEPLTSSSNIK
ncbi:hypothetical protein Tco_0039740 [Tanacetum coccineum]